MNLAVRISIAVAVIALLIWASRRLDRKWRENHPHEKPFAWGYFQALLFFPAGLLWLVLPFIGDVTAWQLWLCIVVYGMIGSFAGYTLIRKKKKWAWVFVVAAQLNLITWLINFYYGSSRWQEFR